MRLLAAVTVTFVVILALLGLTLDAAVRRTGVASFDDSLLAKAKALSLTVEQHDSGMQFEFDPHDMPEFSAGKRPSYFEVWVNGKVFAKSESLGQGNVGAAGYGDDVRTAGLFCGAASEWLRGAGGGDAVLAARG